MPIDLLAPTAGARAPRDLLAQPAPTAPAPAAPRDLLAGMTPKAPDTNPKPAAPIESPSVSIGRPGVNPAPGFEYANIQPEGQPPIWVQEAQKEIAKHTTAYMPPSHEEKKAIYEKWRNAGIGPDATVKDYVNTPLSSPTQRIVEAAADKVNAIGSNLNDTGGVLARSAARLVPGTELGAALTDAAQQSRQGFEQNATHEDTVANRILGGTAGIAFDVALTGGDPNKMAALGALRGVDASHEAGGSNLQQVAHGLLGAGAAYVKLPGAQKIAGAVLSRLPAAVSESIAAKLAAAIPLTYAENYALTAAQKAAGNVIDGRPVGQDVISQNTAVDSIAPGVAFGVHAGLAHQGEPRPLAPAADAAPIDAPIETAPRPPRDLLAPHIEEAIDAQEKEIPRAESSANIPENIPAARPPRDLLAEKPLTPALSPVLREEGAQAPRDLLAEIDTTKTPSVRDAINAVDGPHDAALEQDIQGMAAEDQEAARRGRAMTYTADDLRGMDNAKIRKVAQDLGVTADARGTTIPRILDAQQKGSLAGLTNKELYWKVKELGGKAGSRAKNLEFLLGYEPPAAPAENKPNGPAQSDVSTPDDAQQVRAVEESPAGQGQEQIPAPEGQGKEAPPAQEGRQAEPVHEEVKRRGRDVLASATRRDPWGNDVPDPIAQDILKTPGVADEIPAGSKPIGAGAASFVLETPEGDVVRIGPKGGRPNTPDVLQPTSSKEIGNWQVERLPKVETNGITGQDVQTMSDRLKRQGYEFSDPGTDNLGRTKDGRLVVIDAGAVRALANKDGQRPAGPPAESPEVLQPGITDEGALRTSQRRSTEPLQAEANDTPQNPVVKKKRPERTPFTKASVGQKLQQFHEELGGGWSRDDQQAFENAGTGANQFTFLNKFPGELQGIRESNPAAFGKLFRLTSDRSQAGGEDAMSSLGDRYATMVDQLVNGQTKQAKEFVEKHGTDEMKFWAQVHDQIPPAADRPAQIGKPKEELQTGQTFKMFGHDFEVTEDADGFKILKDGNDFDPIALDAMQDGTKLPVDKGTLTEPKEPELPEGDPFADLPEKMPAASQEPAYPRNDSGFRRTSGASERQKARWAREESEARALIERARPTRDRLIAEGIPLDEANTRAMREAEGSDAPKFFSADEAGLSQTKPGLFGQATVDAATGNKQGSMFHEPADVRPPVSERVGSKSANDPANTAEMFPKSEPAQPTEQVEQAPRDQGKNDHYDAADELRKNATGKHDRKDTLRRPGYVNLLPIEAAAKAIGKAVKEAPEKAKEATQNARDYLTIDALPKLSRAGVADPAVEHASARVALPHVVNDLLSRVFPDQYKDPAAMAKTIDILNKDNILAGYDQFRELAKQARTNGDAASARRYLELADDITDVHDIDAYDAQVRAALNDPTISANIDRWKDQVNPTLDQLFNEVKRVDPFLQRDGRGRHTDARINLLSEEAAKEWQAMKGDDNQPIPEPKTANYRNPNVKRDKFDRSASFTGQYATDAETILSSVIGPRLNEATKLRLYNSLTKAGVAVEIDPGMPGPKEISGKTAVRLPIQVPQTDPVTGKTTRVEKSLLVRSDHYREIRDVLNTDQKAPPGPLAKILTNIQLAQVADAVTHSKNLLSVVTHAQGAGKAWTDAVRKVPFLGSADAIGRIMKVAREVSADTPEIRAEIADMAKRGLIRPSHPATGIQKIARTSEVLHKIDTASRIIMNRFYDNLVERGLAKDTPGNRYKYVNQVGQYNRRLMGPTMAMMRDKGWSPFIVAGRNFNRFGKRIVTGNPGVEATSNAAAAKLHLMNHLGKAMLITVPMMLNSITTGTPGGRSGTPLGAWDLGKDEEDGRHKVIDLLQITGMRRGLRSIGADAAIEGLREGKDLNTIGGEAITQAMQAAAHPWLGPALGFGFKTATGRQLDMRGQMEAQKMTGAAQYVENFRAALESQNPLVYSLARPLFQASGFDQEPDKPKDRPVPTLLKSPLGAFGVKDVTRGTNEAEDLAHTLAFKGDGMTPEEAQVYATRKDLLTTLRKDPAAGKKAVDNAVNKGEITELQAANLTKKAGVSPFKWTVKSLKAEDAVEVYKVSTPEQKKEIGDEVRSKILNSKDGAEAQDKWLKETGISAPPDLEFERELRGLRVKKTKFDNAMREARDAAADERKAKYDAAKPLRLQGSEAGRLEFLESYSEQLKAIEKQVKQGKITPQEGDRRIRLTVGHAMKKRAGRG